MFRKSNLDAERTYMEASLALSIKTLTKNKISASLSNQAKDSQIPINQGVRKNKSCFYIKNLKYLEFTRCKICFNQNCYYHFHFNDGSCSYI